jgi:quercetin dioxygenase-like cupin family protein
MNIFRFDPDAGREIEQFGSVGTILARIVHLEDEAVVHCVYIQAHGKLGYHQAAAPQLFLLVAGEGWVRDASDQKISVKAGQAVFWEKDEWHESGTETGLTAVIIEAVKMYPAEFMSPVQRDEP